MKNLFVLVILTFSLTGRSDKEWLDYRITQYPKNSGNCHEIAAELGEKFAKLTGSEVMESTCVDITMRGFNLNIKYRSPKPLKLVSTVNQVLPGLDERGLFATEKECLAALSAETAHFIEVTKLTPLVSYCFEEKYSSDYSWAIRLDGFGEVLIQPYYGEASFFSRPVGYTLAQYSSAIKTELIRQNIDVRFVTVRYSSVSRLSIMHYAAKKFPVTITTTARLETQDQCQAELQELKQFINSYPRVPLLSYCGFAEILGGFEVTLIYADRQNLKPRPSAENFETYVSCRENRSVLVEYYQNKLKRPVVGSICSRESKTWKVVMFENIRQSR